MGGINTGRWLLGGVVGGIAMWLIEGVSSQLYANEMMTAMQQHSLSMEMNAGTMLMTVAISLLVSLGIVWVYALARPRLGPGPKSAVLVGIGTFVFFYSPMMIGYSMIGLYPNGLLVQWAMVGFIETLVVSLIGGWLYRE